MLLALDTSSKACSCAVFENEQLLAEGYLNCGLTHSGTLTALIENTMKTARKSFDEIDFIALTVGPGSYTGLRIALSAAKGMAMVKKLPCIPVTPFFRWRITLPCITALSAPRWMPEWVRFSRRFLKSKTARSPD